MMLRQLFCLLSAFLLILAAALPIAAEGEDAATVSIAETVAAQIPEEQMRLCGANTLQEWVDGGLSSQAGMGAEWYLLGLCQLPGVEALSYASYESAMLRYIKSNSVPSASARLKHVLCLSAVGGTDACISSELDRSLGAQGLMSLVFGLHLLNNGYVSANHTAEQTVEALLSLQKEDGGWAVTGAVSDVDATAMTLQALAPHREDPRVSAAVEAALELLSARQQPDGSFMAYGVRNAESGAQVVIALAELGLDCETDPRFAKGEGTLWEQLMTYRCEGGFSHVAGGSVNGNANSQVYLAAVAYLRMKAGKAPLFQLDRARPNEVETGESTPSTTPNVPTPEGEHTKEQAPRSGSYKPVVCVILAGVGALGCLLLFLLKKRSVKHYLSLLLAVAVAMTLVLVTDLRSVNDYYGGVAVTKEAPVGTVTLTVRCDTVVSKTDADYVPRDGVILPTVTLELAEGESVYQLLAQAAQVYRIQLETNGVGEMIYVEGINYLYELAFGDLSGWVYRVNGERPSVGCGGYYPQNGDRIEFLYSCDLGNDLP